MQLELLDNIQFIYELNLAELELESFSDNYKLGEDYRTFDLMGEHAEDFCSDMKERLAYFKNVNGDLSDYYHLQKYNQTNSPNQYLTHWIYPYKGKFHPQMIRALMNIMKIKKDETILDPFVGSGTSILEAQVLGVNAVGVDVSPLCVLISKVKTMSLEAIEEIISYRDIYKLCTKSNKTDNEKVHDFYKLAEMLAHSDADRRGRDFDKSYTKAVDKMIASIKDYRDARDKYALDLGDASAVKGDARKLSFEDETFDGIITSPPYSIALDYVANDAHALSALGLDVNLIKEQFVGVRGKGSEKVEIYESDMELCYKEMFRVLRKGKFCAVIIGNATVNKQELNTTDKAIDYCESIGFKLVNKIDKIIYGLYNFMQKEYILIFQKP